MKTLHTLTLLAAIAVGTFTSRAQTNNAPSQEPPAAQSANAIAPAEPEGTASTPATPENGTNNNSIRMNFRNASLDRVLDYLSSAAGFTIVLDTPVRGLVTVWNNNPVTRDEAVDILNQALNKNGYAAIRNDRTLTIVSKADAKTRHIPVISGGEPEKIPNNDEIVTQIIPVRFVEAEQLMRDISPLVNPQATIMANASANSIIVTDTQSNIRHLVEIIKAIDSSAEGETAIRVIHLEHANPQETADLLSNLFPDPTRSGNNSQTPIRFGQQGGRGGGGGVGGRGGGGGGGGGPFAGLFGGGAGGGGNANAAGSANQRIQKQSQVVAVADPRTSSIIVSASKDLMEQIEGMVRELDHPSNKEQKVRVFNVENLDPLEIQQNLQDIFQKNTTVNTRNRNSTTQSALTTRANQTTTTTSTTGRGGNTSGFGGGGGAGGGTTFGR